MMENDGGPAFPQREDGAEGGMSLRDWFAGMALSACLAQFYDGDKEWERYVAGHAYLLADAMVREKTALEAEE